MPDPHTKTLQIQLEMVGENEVKGLLINGIRYRLEPDLPLSSSTDDCHQKAAAVSASSLVPDPVDADRQGRRTLFVQTRNGILTLTLLIMMEVAIEWFWYRKDTALLDQFLWWIFYLDLTVVSLVVTIGYLRSYRYAQTNHMISMMIGMTVGMQVGMMTGGVIGATDGYFMGAIVGVGLGTFLGVGTAWCCGPMAITQALMSGVMGGTMGSMIVAMMPADRLLIFMPIFTLLNIAILVWFSFLFFRDCVVGERCHFDRPMPWWRTFLLSMLAVGGLGGLMVLNPEHSEHFMSGDTGADAGNPFKSEAIEGSQRSPEKTEMRSGSGMSCGANMKR